MISGSAEVILRVPCFLATFFQKLATGCGDVGMFFAPGLVLSVIQPTALELMIDHHFLISGQEHEMGWVKTK